MFTILGRMDTLIPVERIAQKIYLIRRQRVMLDSDLAVLYGVATKVFNQAVKRNQERFPMDFMFQMSIDEAKSLRSQFVTLEKAKGRGKYPKYLPYVFTEQGVAMLSSVLKSPRAIEVNIAIMRTFVKLREILATHKEVSRKIHELEQMINTHDTQIRSIYEAIRNLMEVSEKPRNPVGFKRETES